MDRSRVVVVGGGQAGLAMAHALTSRGLRGDDVVVVDAADQTGATWTARWESLRLFTPARYSALPGMAFPGPPDAYPGKDDVAAYLRAYAARLGLPVRHGTRVTELTQDRTGRGFVLHTSTGTVRADTAVVATGPFQVPVAPPVTAGLAQHVVQLHSADYRNPAQLPAGPVLVVGAANSGAQIALELAATHQVMLSVGTRLPTLPQRLAGQDVFTWLARTRVMDIDVETPLGRRLARRDVLVGTRFRQLRAAGVDLRGRVLAAGGRQVTLDGGSTAEPASIVWATGYRPDFSWLPRAVLGPDGRPAHTRGLTTLPGLAVLGLPWLRTRGSALLGWVGRDAAWLADRLLTDRVHPVGLTTSSATVRRSRLPGPERPGVDPFPASRPRRGGADKGQDEARRGPPAPGREVGG